MIKEYANNLIEKNKFLPINDEIRRAFMSLYDITRDDIDDIETEVISKSLNCMVYDVNRIIVSRGYQALETEINADVKLNNTTVTEVVEKPIETITQTTTVPIEPKEVVLGTNDIQESEEVFNVTLEESEDDFIQINDNVKIPNMDYAQVYWKTSQVRVVVPSKHINSTKKAPIRTLIGVSAMSAKEGANTIDCTGKGARIMNVRNLNRLTQNLMETRNLKASTINTHIKKLLKLKSKEFEYVTLVNPNNNKEEGYYRLDYSDGFVQLDLRVMHYMFTMYADNLIQAYIIFLWNCREGWAQLTREQMAQHLGLTIHSDKQAKMIMDKLVMDGFIEQRTQYHTIQAVDNATGTPRAYTVPYYEYRVVNIEEYIN